MNRADWLRSWRKFSFVWVDSQGLRAPAELAYGASSESRLTRLVALLQLGGLGHSNLSLLTV